MAERRLIQNLGPVIMPHFFSPPHEAIRAWTAASGRPNWLTDEIVQAQPFVAGRP